mgnify:CR=1 FL=1
MACCIENKSTLEMYSNSTMQEKILPKLKFRSNQKVVSFIATINLAQLKKFLGKKIKIVRAIPLPPISLKKGPVPIYPPDKQVKSFFDKIGTLVHPPPY